MKRELTAERLREVLAYDPDTGVFTWLVRTGRRVKVGDVAGCDDIAKGYRQVRIDGVAHGSHRLAWMYVTGSWPARMIDHVNGDRADNRFANLREATPS